MTSRYGRHFDIFSFFLLFSIDSPRTPATDTDVHRQRAKGIAHNLDE